MGLYEIHDAARELGISTYLTGSYFDAKTICNPWRPSKDVKNHDILEVNNIQINLKQN